MLAEAAEAFAILLGQSGPRDASTPTAWLPLAEAARRLRQAQQGSDLDQLSRGLAETEESLLAFWAAQVARSGVAVYGRRIMSARLAPIPAQEIATGRFIHGATRFDPGRGHPTQDICALQVRIGDLETCLSRSAV